MAKYQRAYELMLASMTRLPEEVLESTFVKGLKPEVRAEVRVLKPIGLGQIMEIAQLVKDKNLAIKSLKDPNGLKYSRPNSFVQERVKMSESNLKPNSFGVRDGNRQSEPFLMKMVAWGTRSTPPVHDYPRRLLNLIEAEVQARREKGSMFPL